MGPTSKGRGGDGKGRRVAEGIGRGEDEMVPHPFTPP